MESKIKLLTHKAPWEHNINFLLVDYCKGKKAYAEPLVMRVDTGGSVLNPSPTFSLPPEAIQDLFNQLWILGFRPQDGTGNEGHVQALKNHLADMQKLVFKGK